MLALVALLLTLVVVEIGFRLWGAFSSAGKSPPRGDAHGMAEIVQVSQDPDLIYEYRPNVDTKNYPRFTNSVGMRGPERSVEHDPNVVRIAGIGDSVMAGDMYPAEKTFLFVLEDLLNDAASSPVRFEVLNFAVGGYNAVQERIVLERKALAYDPAWVILAVAINDWEPPVFFRMRGEDGQDKLFDRYQLEARLRFGAGLNPERLPWWAHSTAVRWIRTRFLWDYRVKVFRRAVREMAAICRENSIRMLVVILTEDVEVGQTDDPREKWHRVVRAAVRDAETREGEIALLDLYPILKEHLAEAGLQSYRHYWTSEHDPHPNADGHRLHAELIFKKLVSLGILDEKPTPNN